MRKIILFWGDVAILYIALFLTIFIRYGGGFQFEQKLSIHFVPFTIIFALWVLVFYIANLFEISNSKNNIGFYSAFFYAIAVNVAVLISFFYLIPYFKITPKTNLFIFLAIEVLLDTGWRFYFNRLLIKANFKNNTLILGVSEQSQNLYDLLLANPQLGYNVAGIIDTEHTTAPEILENIIRQKKIETLVLGPMAYKVPSIIDVLYRLVGLKINFYNLADFYEMLTGKVPVGTIDQAWFLENLSEGRKKAYELSKRFFDLLLATVIGLVTLPFYPFIIWAIKANSKGPVFYHQARVGQGGKTFSLIKFRTMIQDAEKNSGPIWATEDDVRTTKVGKFIRRSRIDELPQMLNIIKGQMSFVGPRPERPEFHEKLKAQIPFYEERYLIKPGFTGWTQIKYKLDFKGGLTIKDTFEKLQYDLYYIKNRSFLLDFGIILKTINLIARKLV